MDFSANKQDTYEKRIASLPDQPNMQPDELKAYFDSSPEQLRQAHNALCDALTEATSGTSAAANLGFQSTAGVPADNVQDAIEDVQSQLTDAVLGNIPSGSVTNDKLAQDVRDHFTTIENAAASEASTRASADSSLQSQINTHTSQISSLTTAKCEVVFGSYTGDKAAERTITLGFTPSAVISVDKCGTIGDGAYKWGGMVIRNHPHDGSGITLCDNGFKVYYSESERIYSNVSSSSHSPFAYIAFK